jgi:flagellar biosynthesis protein FlhF
MSIAAVAESPNLIAFPRADLRGLLGGALKRHRLPENLAAELVRDAQKFPDVSADAALAFALDGRMKAAPIDFDKARGILLVGPAGGGKSAVADKILHAATLAGRRTERARADCGLALFRTNSNPPDLLTVMEADGFNPLNARAASAFSALGEIEGVETIGVVSALNDAEDVADIIAAFRFRRVIATHMDRTRRLGALLAAATGGALLAHVTHGPRPEDALEILAPGRLAALLLEKAQH